MAALANSTRWTARPICQRCSRQLYTTRIWSNQTVDPSRNIYVEAALKPKRPIPSFRAGVVGFLLGLSLAGGSGFYLLFDQYKKASKMLLLSVDELRDSTEKLSDQLRRIERVERSMESLQKTRCTREELDRVKADLRRTSESQHLDLLQLKAHLFGIEQDLGVLLKREQTTIRI